MRSMIPAGMLPFLLLVLPGQISGVFAAVQFVIANGPCDGTGLFNSCNYTHVSGLCAFASDVGRSWCCAPEWPVCSSFGQGCSAGETIAGKNQLFCQSGDVHWCCDSRYETCNNEENAINLCDTNFVNPYNNVSTADAVSLSKAYFATATSTQTAAASRTLSTVTTAVSSTSSTTGSTADVVGVSSTASSPGGAATTIATNKTNLSTGAKAGIAVGAVAAAVILVVAAFLIGRRYKKNHTGEKEYPKSSEHEQPPQNEYNPEAAPSELGPSSDSQQAQQTAWRETLGRPKMKPTVAEIGTEHRTHELP